LPPPTATWRALLHGEQWLLIEGPKDSAEPTKYWLANLSATTPLKQLVRLAKLRWRIERDFQELKQELGPNHFEVRSWSGFHHHATLCIAAYGFLIAERCAFPPLVLAAAQASARRAISGHAAPRIPSLNAVFSLILPVRNPLPIAADH
jgi:SRSO17 transposase